MIDKTAFTEVLAAYKKVFPKTWKKEEYKWIAVKQFQDHWDIQAQNFSDMFMTATSKTDKLLASDHDFSREMIRKFALSDAEAVRSMFSNLYDESKSLTERIKQFKDDIETIRIQAGENSWESHFQTANVISTYLWLRYPDKYYIYKYTECLSVSKNLKSDFVPRKSASADNVTGCFKLYDEICSELLKDAELIQMFQDVRTDLCYPDHQLKTLTNDFGYFIYKQNNPKENDWFPAEFDPGFTVSDWIELLNDPIVFTADSLEIMKCFKECGGQATCKELSIKFGKTAQFYNNGSTTLAKRIIKKTGCPVLEHNNKNSKWWPILYQGKYADKDTVGRYIWRLRDELSEAIDEINSSAEPPSIEYSETDFLSEVYLTEEKYHELISLLKNKKNLILQGAPGVGKTFAARRLAYAMMGERDDSRIEMIQFHQNYSYEDFIMGYKPREEGFKLEKGIFYKFCEKAEKDPDRAYFFIIDEINRGNLSKIFGELLMLIEKDYRGTEIKLAYSGESFSVPPNLYMIGMMNTADRSLAMIDYALRRRFSFFELKPAFESEGFRKYQESLNNDTFNRLIQKIIELNHVVDKDDSLGPGFCIGHSYFCDQTACSSTWMKEVVKYDIVPMLNEYWFDDRNKVLQWEKVLTGSLHDE